VSTGDGQVHPLVVAFYGPVVKEGTGTAITLEMINPVTGDPAPMPETAYSTAVSGRFLTITAYNSTLILPQGRYRVTPNRTGTNRLPCDDLLGSSVPVADTVYEFFLIDDCGASCGSCTTPLCFYADWDFDSDVDSGDSSQFFIGWDTGNADADFESDTDSDAIVEFFCWWNQGGCP